MWCIVVIYIKMIIGVPSFQIHKLDLLLVLQKPDFLSIILLQNAKTDRKLAALIINRFCSKYNLLNPWQTYRGRRIVFVTQNYPNWVIFTKTHGELFLDPIFVLVNGRHVIVRYQTACTFTVVGLRYVTPLPEY